MNTKKLLVKLNFEIFWCLASQNELVFSAIISILLKLLSSKEGACFNIIYFSISYFIIDKNYEVFKY